MGSCFVASLGLVLGPIEWTSQALNSKPDKKECYRSKAHVFNHKHVFSDGCNAELVYR